MFIIIVCNVYHNVYEFNKIEISKHDAFYQQDTGYAYILVDQHPLQHKMEDQTSYSIYQMET